jgi:hypothetical protein
VSGLTAASRVGRSEDDDSSQRQWLRNDDTDRRFGMQDAPLSAAQSGAPIIHSALGLYRIAGGL